MTYRVYDYDRVDKNGKKRELHFDKAVQVMDMKVAPDVSQKPRMVKYYSGCSRELLCRCKYFETEQDSGHKGLCLFGEGNFFSGVDVPKRYGEVQTMVQSRNQGGLAKVKHCFYRQDWADVWLLAMQN